MKKILFAPWISRSVPWAPLLILVPSSIVSQKLTTIKNHKCPLKRSQRDRTTPFKVKVAKVKTPTKTILLQFGIGDWKFKVTFIVAKRITGPILGVTFLNSAILDVSQGLSHFLKLKYSVETDESTRNKNSNKVQTKNPITIPPETIQTKTNTAHTDVSSNIKHNRCHQPSHQSLHRGTSGSR